MAHELEVRPAALQDRAVLQELYREHLFVLREFDRDIDTEQQLQDDWFEHPELEPLLIEQQGAVVGFALLLGRAHSEAMGEDVDHNLFEYFVAPECRGTGLAEKAVRRIVDARPGVWSLRCMLDNRRALRFWSRVLARYGASHEQLGGEPEMGRFQYHVR